ncbi:MAG: KUP/HAK/KT family potassium transporter [Aquificaceae bacterium]
MSAFTPLKREIGDTVRAVGTVFGDIGTSPLYTLTVIMLLTKPKGEEVLGVASLILWTLVLIATIQYAWFAMNLSIRGEGGIVVLSQIALSLANNKSLRRLIRILSLIGLSFLLGDGVITPAITILSASEGIRLVPNFEHLSQWTVIFIAILITIGLFSVQSKGTGKLGEYFGPVMLLWFFSLAFIGLYHISLAPSVIKALSPHYAIEFLISDPVRGFVALSEALLAVTGAEAMYADMGHLGKSPIRKAWFFVVFPTLALNYLGQTAFVIKHDGNLDAVFYQAAKASLGSFLYIPFLLLVISASIIASQALISGIFSLVFQAINARMAPMLNIKHTSTEISTQIYIPFINWALMAGVLLMYFVFKNSDSMASAYGLAVITTMSVTCFYLTTIYLLKRYIFYFFVSFLLLAVDFIFFFSTLTKIPHGAYWSLIFALFPLIITSLYMAGQRKLYEKMNMMPFKEFLLRFEEVYKKATKIEGTAIFLIRDLHLIPPYVVQTMFQQGIMYEDNLFLSLVKETEPFGVEVFLKGSIAPGLRLAEIRYGYMEVLDIERYLAKIGVEERIIFYGTERIYTDKFYWKIFGFIKRSTPTFVEFYRFPSQKLHGVMVTVEL